MRKYCEECKKEVETKVVTKKETYDVCGEAIEVDAKKVGKSSIMKNLIMLL